jgi:hypothetical protein
VCGSLAAWEGNAWHSIGVVDGKGWVMALARLGRVLYVAGSFSGVNGKPMSNLARHTFSKILFIVTLLCLLHVLTYLECLSQLC